MGKKFTEKYNVKLDAGYTADPDDLVIPPVGHALHDPDGNTAFDPRRVAEIDKDGALTGTVTVWSDPDLGKLFLVEGRGLTLDCREVNRLRRERGDDVIRIPLKRLDVDLDRAVEHVAIRNFHRKVPTASHVAREIVRYHRLGKPWARIAELLYIVTAAPEQHLRSFVPLAHCISDVCAMIDSGKWSRKMAVKFGGRAIDGSERLGDKEQADLFAKSTETSEKPQKPATVRLPSPRVMEAMRGALNGETVKARDIVDFLMGRPKALTSHSPDVAALLLNARSAASKPGRKAAVES